MNPAVLPVNGNADLRPCARNARFEKTLFPKDKPLRYQSKVLPFGEQRVTGKTAGGYMSGKEVRQ